MRMKNYQTNGVLVWKYHLFLDIAYNNTINPAIAMVLMVYECVLIASHARSYVKLRLDVFIAHTSHKVLQDLVTFVYHKIN